MQGKEHMNLQAVDPGLGPVLLSVKDISCEEGPKVNMDPGLGPVLLSARIFPVRRDQR